MMLGRCVTGGAAAAAVAAAAQAAAMLAADVVEAVAAAAAAEAALAEAFALASSTEALRNALAAVAVRVSAARVPPAAHAASSDGSNRRCLWRSGVVRRSGEEAHRLEIRKRRWTMMAARTEATVAAATVAALPARHAAAE